MLLLPLKLLIFLIWLEPYTTVLVHKKKNLQPTASSDFPWQEERQAREGTCCEDSPPAKELAGGEIWGKNTSWEVLGRRMWAKSWQPRHSPAAPWGLWPTVLFPSFLHFLPFYCTAVVTHPCAWRDLSSPPQLCIHHTPCTAFCLLLLFLGLLPPHSLPFAPENPLQLRIPSQYGDPTGKQLSQTLLADSRCSPSPLSLYLPVLGISFPCRLVCCHTLLSHCSWDNGSPWWHWISDLSLAQGHNFYHFAKW